MNNPNLYWSVYKNLEKEVLKLSYSIYFCDNQLDVFSVHIAELLIRCAVEIESISKELYQQEGGDMEPVDEEGKKRHLKYDFDCLKQLDKNWKIGKKQVIIVAQLMYFSREENRIFSPLKKTHKGDATWQKSYQAVKHYRVESIDKADIKSLLRALASLYLLNIYYANYNLIKVVENSAYIPIERLSFSNSDLLKLDLTFGSQLFQVSCFNGVLSGITLDGVLHVDAKQGEYDYYVAVSVEKNGDKFSDSDIRELYPKLCNYHGSRMMR
jgi:hypothetical protein